MRKKGIVRIVLPVLGLMILVPVFYHIVAYDISENEEKYSGDGIYSLSTMEPFSVSNTACDGEINILNPVFSTNTARILIKNQGIEDIEAYLFIVDSEIEGKVKAAETAISPGKTKAFTNLSSEKVYEIGIYSANHYSVIVKD